MSASLEFLVGLGKLGPHPLRDGLALDPEPSFRRQPAPVREAEEVERLRFPVQHRTKRVASYLSTPLHASGATMS